MAIMQGGDTWFWLWLSILLTGAFSLATWFYTIVGRDRKIARQRRGEKTVERFGTIEEDRAPIPKFLIWTYVGLAVWAVVYAVWTGIEGIGM